MGGFYGPPRIPGQLGAQQPRQGGGTLQEYLSNLAARYAAWRDARPYQAPPPVARPPVAAPQATAPTTPPPPPGDLAAAAEALRQRGTTRNIWFDEPTPGTGADTTQDATLGSVMRGPNGEILLTNLADSKKGLGYEPVQGAQVSAEPMHLSSLSSGQVATVRPGGRGAFSPSAPVPGADLAFGDVFGTSDKPSQFTPAQQELWMENQAKAQGLALPQAQIAALSAESALKGKQGDLYGAQAEELRSPTSGSLMKDIEYLRRNPAVYDSAITSLVPKHLDQILMERGVWIPGTPRPKLDTQLEKVLVDQARARAEQEYAGNNSIALQAARLRSGMF